MVIHIVCPSVAVSFVRSFILGRLSMSLFCFYMSHRHIFIDFARKGGVWVQKKTIILIRISESIYLQMTSRPQFSLEKLSRGKNKNYFVFAFCHKQKTTTAVAARKISQQPIEIAQLLQLLINYYNNIYK